MIGRTGIYKHTPSMNSNLGGPGFLGNLEGRRFTIVGIYRDPIRVYNLENRKNPWYKVKFINYNVPLYLTKESMILDKNTNTNFIAYNPINKPE